MIYDKHNKNNPKVVLKNIKHCRLISKTMSKHINYEIHIIYMLKIQNNHFNCKTIYKISVIEHIAKKSIKILKMIYKLIIISIYSNSSL